LNELKYALDMGLGVVGFLAFLKLVFNDMADLRQRLERLEKEAHLQNNYLSRLVNVIEAQAMRQGISFRKVKEEKNE
jgi:hypothetical protein